MFAEFHAASAFIGASVAFVIIFILMSPWTSVSQHPREHTAPGIDPWAMQSELMTISGQKQPKAPEINKASMMYLALIMEETAETYDAVQEALKWSNEAHKVSVVVDVMRLMKEVQLHNAAASIAIRGLLEDCPEDFRVGLSEARALEIFDGTTDVTVVNCGFSQASGFPGAAGYVEVAESNLSKKNPMTGVIDKTADGKWIKGVNYYKPALGSVLRLHCYKPGLILPMSEAA